MTGKYDDIIHMSRHVSSTRKGMSIHDRAAQFSPFAALVGYEDTLEESARLTGKRIELDESEKYMLDLIQQQLLKQIDRKPEVTVTYFVSDSIKDGGQYITVSGQLHALLPHRRCMILLDGTTIPLDDVLQLDSPILGETDK